MAKFRETKIPIAEFLEAYRCQPCLYNSLLDTYKNRIAREEAYEAIIRTLKIPQLTVLDIKLKIKSVRTVYTKELRILMRERELGRSYIPKLFWFKLADSFLRAVSLSHYKRLKNKQVHVDSSCTSSTSSTLATLNKEVSQSNNNNNNSVLTNEDALHSTLEQKDEEVHHDTYLPELVVVQGGKRKMSIGTNTNPPPEAGCQTEDMPSNKSELMIDEANTLCMMEQQQEQQEQQQQQQHQEQEQLHQHQQQQQTTMLRKLKYMAYPSQSQSQLPHRQSTPFTSPSPSSQQLDMATSTSSVGPCYAGPGPNAPVVTSSAEDDLMIFGQSIASQLRTIPDPYSRSVAKLRIQQVLFEAETGQSSGTINPHLHSF